MPIQDFDVAKGKAIDPRRKQVIVAMEQGDDLSVVLNTIRERRLHLLGTEKQPRAILELMRKHKTGTLLLDKDLPGINMDEFFLEIKRKYPEFALIIISRALTKEDLAKKSETFVLDFLAKPLKHDPVLKTLSRIK